MLLCDLEHIRADYLWSELNTPCLLRFLNPRKIYPPVSLPSANSWMRRRRPASRRRIKKTRKQTQSIRTGMRGNTSAKGMSSAGSKSSLLSPNSSGKTSVGGSKLTEMEAMKGERLSNYNKGIYASSAQFGAGREREHFGASQNSVAVERSRNMRSLSNPEEACFNPHGRIHMDGAMREQMMGVTKGETIVNDGGQGLVSNGAAFANPHLLYGGIGHRNGYHDYVNVNYLSMSRPKSDVPNPIGQQSPWMKSPMGRGTRMAMSETESMENIAGVENSYMKYGSTPMQRGLLYRSDSFKSTGQDGNPPHSASSSLPRAGSVSHVFSSQRLMMPPTSPDTFGQIF